MNVTRLHMKSLRKIPEILRVFIEIHLKNYALDMCRLKKSLQNWFLVITKHSLVAVIVFLSSNIEAYRYEECYDYQKYTSPIKKKKNVFRYFAIKLLTYVYQKYHTCTVFLQHLLSPQQYWSSSHIPNSQ